MNLYSEVSRRYRCGKNHFAFDPALDEVRKYGHIARNAMPVPVKAKCLGGLVVLKKFKGS